MLMTTSTIDMLMRFRTYITNFSTFKDILFCEIFYIFHFQILQLIFLAKKVLKNRLK